MNQCALKFVHCAVICSLLSACGGGGGGGGGSGGGTWDVRANITSDGCRDRIANVTQRFVIAEANGAVTVNTSLVTVSGTETGGTLSFGFSEGANGCTRSYSGEFSNMGGGLADIALRSETTCDDGSSCVNTWTGTATQVQ